MSGWRQPVFEGLDAIEQLGQSAFGHHDGAHFPRGHCRKSHVGAGPRQVLGHAAASRHHHLGAQFQMPRNPGLGRDHDVIPDRYATGDPDLGDDDAVLADDDVVSNLDEVIDFRSLPDPRLAESCAIDC